MGADGMAYKVNYNMKERLLTNWNFMRWIRLLIGIYIGIEAIRTQEIISGFFAVFFLFQAFTNTGCCGANSCTVPLPKNKRED